MFSDVQYKKRSFGIFFLPFLFLLAGCSTVLPDGMENHIIAADYLGEPAFFDTVDSQGKIVRKKETVTLRDHLARMKAQMAKSGRKKIMIYCFGGMNSFEETIRASARLTEAIAKDNPKIYPIFVNWDSELFGCYCEDVFYIRQGVVDRWLGPPTAPLYFLQNLTQSLIRLPMNMLSQAQVIPSLYADDLFTELRDALLPQKTEISWHMGEDRSDHSRDVFARLGYVAGLPVRVVTGGLISAFGSRGWKEMRRRSRLAFVKEPDKGSARENAVSMFTARQDGVFSYFAAMLQEYVEAHPDTEITLIGHCMGTFIATEILSRYPELPVKNIVFMAGASPVQETASVLKPYLQRHPESHFYNLCLHPRIDWFDMMDYAVLPCGSVLSWVNEFLTEPLSKEDYTVGLWGASILILPRMMTGVEKQVTLKAFGIDDPVTNVGEELMPYQHTDFNNPKVRFWRKEFWDVPEAAKRNRRSNQKER